MSASWVGTEEGALSTTSQEAAQAEAAALCACLQGADIAGGFDGETFTNAQNIEGEDNDEDDGTQEGEQGIEGMEAEQESPNQFDNKPVQSENGQGNGSSSVSR
ncbi:hypothetical protein L7F22_013251 [Adiantum nelumboides]|nr:hypothetical protein [Adiantum nelumboides]